MPDVCWAAKRNWMICGPGSPAASRLAIGIKNVLYGRVLGLRGDTDAGDCLEAKPFDAGRSSRRTVVSRIVFRIVVFSAARRRPAVPNSLLPFVTPESRLAASLAVRSNAAWEWHPMPVALLR